MTIHVGTNMEMKVPMTETKRRLLVNRMVRMSSMKLIPVVRKHPLAIKNFIMMM
jgi:hypothetical protein